MIKSNRQPGLALLMLLATLNCPLLSAHAQGTAFTYQGRLNDGANQANGSYDFQFIIYDSNVGGAQQGPILTNSAVAVVNGLFNVTLDFGNQFSGAAQFMEIAVRTNNTGGFFTLSPRQALTPAPYAITASNLTGVLPPSGLSGTYSGAVNLNNQANSFSGDAGGLTNLGAGSLVGTVPDARLSANVALRSGGNNFSGNQTVANGSVGIGTTSPNRPLAIRGAGPSGEWLSLIDTNGTTRWHLNNLLGGLNFAQTSLADGRLFLGTNGTVGIGTIAPEAPLHVTDGSAGTVTANANSIAAFERANNAYVSILAPLANETGILFGDPDSAQDGGVIFNSTLARSGFEFRTGTNLNRMTILANGNVGIGTTFPQGLLHVAGSTVMQGLVTPSSAVATNLLNLGSGVTADGFRNGISFYESGGAMAMSLGYDGTGNASQNAMRIYHTSGNPLFTFQANGGLGIGTTNPVTALHVKNAGDTQVSIESTDSGSHRWTLQSSSVSGNTNLDASFQIIDRSVGAPRLLIGTNGNVGIGTTKPASTLEVNGTLTVQNVVVTNTITRPYATGATPSLIYPIAYGNVASDGSAESGTLNFTATWNSSFSEYDITITGESYSFISYTAVVTAVGLSPVIPATFSSGGKLAVRLFNSAGQAVQSDFCFAVYKAR